MNQKQTPRDVIELCDSSSTDGELNYSSSLDPNMKLKREESLIIISHGKTVSAICLSSEDEFDLESRRKKQVPYLFE